MWEFLYIERQQYHSHSHRYRHRYLPALGFIIGHAYSRSTVPFIFLNAFTFRSESQHIHILHLNTQHNAKYINVYMLYSRANVKLF